MTTAGIYLASDMPMSVYLHDPCDEPSLSSGAAHKIVTRSPLHVWSDHPRFGASVPESSDAADIGAIAHDLLLGGESKICVIDPAQYRSKPTKDNPDGTIPVGWTNGAIRAARDEARQNGLTPILIGAMAGARTMVAEAQQFIARSELAGVFNQGAGETTMIWKDGPSWCRARPDWLNHEDKVLLHYKTTRASAAPDPFIRGIMMSSGYDVAMAFYRRGLEHLTGCMDFRHVILVQEQASPYACSLVSLDPAAWAIADQTVSRALTLWAECMASDNWPAYGGRIHYASPTAWQLAEAEAMLEPAL